MTGGAGSPRSDNVRLKRIIAEYLQQPRGEAPSPAELIQRHPDLKDELEAFFAQRDRARLLADEAVEQDLDIVNDPDLPTVPPCDSSSERFRSAPDTPSTSDSPTSASKESSGGEARPLGTKVRYFGDYKLLEEIARGGMGVVEIWRVEHPKPITGATFSGDESRVLSWPEGLMCLSNARTGAELCRFVGRSVNHAAFSKNQSRILSWGSAGASLWDVSSGQELWHAPGVTEVVFNNDENHILGWRVEQVAPLTNNSGVRHTLRRFGIGADYDWPHESLMLRVELRTGTRLTNSGELEPLTANEWLKRKQAYDEINDRRR